MVRVLEESIEVQSLTILFLVGLIIFAIGAFRMYRGYKDGDKRGNRLTVLGFVAMLPFIIRFLFLFLSYLVENMV